MIEKEIKIGGTRAYIPEKEKETILQNIREVLNSRILTDAKYCQQLEEEFAKKIGTDYAISTSSGTSALEIMIRALNLKGEIIVPTNTFAATVYAIIRAGCKPVFVDGQISIDPNDLKKKLSPKTVAVMTVHIGGFIEEELNEMIDMCESSSCFLFEDACHAHGTMFESISAGSIGHCAGFSFFPTKLMTACEGGMITTNDYKIDGRARIIKDQGKHGRGNECFLLGQNARMSELHAIVALSQLRNLDDFIKTRTTIADFYKKSIVEKLDEEIDILPLDIQNCVPNYYKFIINPKTNREMLVKHFKEHNISVAGYVYETLCHVQPAFDYLGYTKVKFPLAKYFSKNHLCLPLMNNTTMEQAKYVMECLVEYYD